MRPASNPKSKWSPITRTRYVCPITMHATRSANATQKRLRGARNKLGVAAVFDTRKADSGRAFSLPLCSGSREGADSSRSRRTHAGRPSSTSAPAGRSQHCYQYNRCTEIRMHGREPRDSRSGHVLRRLSTAFETGSGVAETASRAEVFVCARRRRLPQRQRSPVRAPPARIHGSSPDRPGSPRQARE